MNTLPITEALNRNVTNHTLDRKLGQVICFVVSGLVLALSLWKLARLELTETQLFFGVLLSFATPLLFVVIGLLLPISSSPKNA